MRYAKEIIALLGTPEFVDAGREWRMAQVVNHVADGKPRTKQQRNRVRQGVRRVLIELVEMHVVEQKPARRGGTTLYRWRTSVEQIEHRGSAGFGVPDIRGLDADDGVDASATRSSTQAL